MQPSVVLMSRPAVGDLVQIQYLTTAKAFHFNGKKATVVRDEGALTLTVLLADGKEMQLLPRHLLTCDVSVVATSGVCSASLSVPAVVQSVAASWISDTSVVAQVQAMPKGKYNLLVNVRNSSSNSQVVHYVESWLDLSPNYSAAEGGSIISISGLGFSNISAYSCSWSVLQHNTSSSSAAITKAATVLSPRKILCPTSSWKELEFAARALSCTGFFCEGRLAFSIEHHEFGRLPGPLDRNDKFVRILPGNAASLIVLLAPVEPIISGVPQQFVIAVRDEHGMNVVSNMTLRVAVVQQGNNHTTLDIIGKTEVISINGVAVFNNLQLMQAMPYELRFSAVMSGGVQLSVSTNIFIVLFGSPFRLRVMTQPVDAVANMAFSQPPVVAAFDSEGNQVLGWSADVRVHLVSLNSSLAAAVLNGPTRMQPDANNSATVRFAHLSIDRVGFFALNFSSPSLVSVVCDLFQVHHGAASSLYAHFLHRNLTSMLPVGPLQVSVRDSGGNIVPVNYSIAASLEFVDTFYPPGFNGMDWSHGTSHNTQGLYARSYDDGREELQGDTEAISLEGVVVFESLLIGAARSGYVLKFSSGALHSSSTCVFSIYTGNCFRISLERHPSGADAVVAFRTQPILAIFDKGDNTVDVSVHISVSLWRNGSDQDPSSMQGNVQILTQTGVARFTDLALIKSHPAIVLRFQSASPCSFSVLSDTFPVLATAPVALHIASQPYEARGGQPLDLIQILIVDVGGNVVVSANVVDVALLLLHGSNTNATLTGVLQRRGINGSADFTGLLIKTAGDYMLQFSSPGLTGITSSVIKIIVGNASHLKLTHDVCEQACFSRVPINPRVCIYDDGQNLVSNSGLVLSANITDLWGYPLSGILSGDVTSSSMTLSCITFSNIWVDVPSRPFVLHFFAVSQTMPVAKHSTMICTSSQPSSPSCNVEVLVVPSSLAIDMKITVKVANSDFSDVDEYISALYVGSERMGDTYLVTDGQDDNCAKTISILDSATVPFNSVSETGHLTVRIETSMAVGGVACHDGATLSAEITVSWITANVAHAFSNAFVVHVGTASFIVILVQPSTVAAMHSFTPWPIVELQDFGGNRAIDTDFKVHVSALSTQQRVHQQLLSSPITCDVLICAPDGLYIKVAVVQDGLAAFSDLALVTQYDNVTLSFTASSNSSSLMLPTVYSSTFSVVPGQAFVQHIIQQPSDSIGGEPLGRQPIISFLDLGGNRVHNVSGVVTAELRSKGNSSAILYGNTSVYITNSTASFTDLTVDGAAKAYYLIFNFLALSPIASTGFDVTHGRPFRLKTVVCSNTSHYVNHASNGRQSCSDNGDDQRSVLLTVRVSVCQLPTSQCPLFRFVWHVLAVC